MSNVALLGGNSLPEMTLTLAEMLDMPKLGSRVNKFYDGEIDVEVLENVRGANIFIVQSISKPTNDNLMELMLLADAVKRASAKSITAVIPYMGYARQDRRVRSQRVAISARVVADMLSTVGISRVLTVDLHSEQIQGFFNMPVDNVYATSIFIDDIRKQNFDSPIVVSPDMGGVVRARAVAKLLDNNELAIIDKRRDQANQSQVMHIIGEVEGRTCLLVDDIIDTAGTLCNAAKSLKEHGAKQVYAYSTHPVLSNDAVEKIDNSPLDGVVVADTIKLSPLAGQSKKIRLITVANLLAKSIQRIDKGESVSALFI